MSKLVMYCGFILWVTYLFLAIYREIKSSNTLKDIKKKPFHFIRIDSIFFLITYLIYDRYIRDDILQYLYLIIIITNIVYLIYDLVDNYGFSKVKKNEILYYSGGILCVLILAIYLILFHKFVKISIITLIIDLFIPIYVTLIKHKKH